MPDHDPDATRVRSDDAPAPHPEGVRPFEATAPYPNVTLVRPPGEQARLPFVAGGAAVPGFEIEGTLGRGGMGVVYRATQTGLNRPVALKMLLAGSFADPDLRARFLLEAESVAALEHPHIVRVFAFGEHAGHPYLAMEFAPGGTLGERIKARGPVPPREAAKLLVKLADAAAHAHSRGVVHRDIKPANVLLAGDGEPRLTDFGLAKVGRLDQGLSVTGQVLGTPAYMAPEQAAGKVHEVGTGADVYALGAVLYDLLTGRPPFAGDSAAVTLQKVMNEEPVRPRQHNAAVPRDLETICLKCLEKDPAKRYATALELGADLRAYLDGRPITARPTGSMERAWRWVARNPAVASSVAFGVLALVIGLVVALAQADVAKEEARRANEAAEKESAQKKLADEKADEAIRNKNLADISAAEAKREAKRADEKAELATKEANRANAEKGRADEKAEPGRCEREGGSGERQKGRGEGRRGHETNETGH